MDKKSFEQQFPSLKQYIFAKKEDGSLEGSNKFWKQIIQEHCLDKQRVKEAIQEEKWHISSHVRDCAKRIEKRLGLE